MLPGLVSAGLFNPLIFAWPILELYYIGRPLSNVCLCYLPHVSYLSSEACAHRVHIDCYLFTESSEASSHLAFFDWATPVKL